MDAVIYDEMPGVARTEVLRLDLKTPTITAEALIRARVELEWERLQPDAQDYDAAMGKARSADCLVTPGRVAPDRKTPLQGVHDRPDAEPMVAAALDGFRRGGFFLFAGDRQIETLEEEIDLAATLDVVFLRLVPLQGG